MPAEKTDAGLTKSDKVLGVLIAVVGFGMVVYHLVYARYPFYDSILHQNTHMGLALVLVFLSGLRVSRKFFSRLLLTLLILVSILVTGYVYVFYRHLSWAIGMPDPRDVIIGTLMVVVVLEATRRTWGLVLPVVGIVFTLYFLYGDLLPYPFVHQPFTFDYVISIVSVGLGGIYGPILDASATFMFLFIVFGGVLEIVGLSPLLVEIGKAAGRISAGGAGVASVVCSSLVGMVTGAALANVTITGSFTIPTMKKAGFKPSTAGAIEATAATGSQIMPPILGTAGFIMSAITGVPYAKIMVASFLPGVLYYISVFFAVRSLALKQGVKGSAEKVDKRIILVRGPAFAIPLMLIVGLLLANFSPAFAGFSGLLSLILVSFVRKETRPTIGRLIQGLGRAAVLGAKVAIACACVGLLAQAIITTGLGARISDSVEVLARGNLVLALAITMVIALLLGVGVPTPAAYTLVAIIAAPVLVRMGVPLLAAHFFCFFFAIISALTPPVAMASLAAASIAGSGYITTSVQAFKLAIASYILPWVIVYNTSILGNFADPLLTVVSFFASVVGLIALASLLSGYSLTSLKALDRVFLGVSVIAAVVYLVTFQYIALSLSVAFFSWHLIAQVRRRRRYAPELPVASN